MVSSYGTGLPPYTVAELENTMDRQPASFIAWSSSIVPPRLLP